MCTGTVVWVFAFLGNGGSPSIYERARTLCPANIPNKTLIVYNAVAGSKAWGKLFLWKPQKSKGKNPHSIYPIGSRTGCLRMAPWLTESFLSQILSSTFSYKATRHLGLIPPSLGECTRSKVERDHSETGLGSRRQKLRPSSPGGLWVVSTLSLWDTRKFGKA